MDKSANSPRLGILGGSFNPIHHGHLLMAELARQNMKLDEVIFIPAACSPYKSSQKMASPSQRMDMVRLAIAGNPHFSASDLEIRRGGISYTVDTLKSLRQQFPGAKLFWIIGDDHVDLLSSWKNFDEIVRIASFIAVSREWFRVSSSEIRDLLKKNRSIRYLTPEPVIGYIQRHGLYQ